MRHRKAKGIIDRTSAQRQRLVRNLAISLITHERITTTPIKARVARSLVEKLITTGKVNDLHHRRLIIKNLNNAVAAKKIIDTLGPRFKDRKGGYSRVTKLGQRQGDGGQQVIVELLPA